MHRHGWRHRWDWPAKWAYGGGWSMGTRLFASGELRIALLSLLESEAKHGYQLMRDLEERSGGIYRASAGSVYPTLQQLEDEGLVVSEQQDGKRVYRLTDAGREELQGHAERIKRIWHRAERWEDWSRWMRPDMAMVAGPVSRIAGAAMKAIARSGEDAARIARVMEILDRARADLDGLGREPDQAQSG